MNPTKPTALKLLEGDIHKERMSPNEPKPDLTMPECPDWLEDEAKKEWFRVVPELYKLKLLTSMDITALIGYCQSWARYVEAEQFLSDHDTVFVTDKGYMGPVPQVAMAQKYLKLCQSFMIQFGMTPSSRGNISIPGNPEDEEIESLITKNAHR